MGRHADTPQTRLGLPRMVVVSGSAGCVAWILGSVAGDRTSRGGLLIGSGAVLLTLALVGLGLMLVRSDFLALRLFVALALPTLVWAVFSLVHGSTGDPGVVDAVFGGLVGLGAGAAAARRGSERRATL